MAELDFAQEHGLPVVIGSAGHDHANIRMIEETSRTLPSLHRQYPLGSMFMEYIAKR